MIKYVRTPLDSLSNYSTVQRRDPHSLSPPPFSCLPLLFCGPVPCLSHHPSLSLQFLLNTHQQNKNKTPRSGLAIFWANGLHLLVPSGISCEWKQLSKKDQGIWSHHLMGSWWGDSGNSVRLYFSGLQNHCRWWLQPWN